MNAIELESGVKNAVVTKGKIHSLYIEQINSFETVPSKLLLYYRLTIYPKIIYFKRLKTYIFSVCYCELYHCTKQRLSIKQGLCIPSGDLTQCSSIKIMNLYCTSLKAHELSREGDEWLMGSED